MRNFLIKNYSYDPGSYDNYHKDLSNLKFLARLDWNISQKHHLSLRYNYTNNNKWNAPSVSRDVTKASFDNPSKYGLTFSNSMYNQMNNLWTYTYGNNGVASPAGRINYNQYGAYVQDEWKVSPKFKLSYGVRADMLAFDNKDLMTNNAIKAISFGGKNVDTGVWPKTRVQVSPRIGFNWDIYGDKSVVVRGGTGLFQGRLPLVFFSTSATSC